MSAGVATLGRMTHPDRMDWFNRLIEVVSAYEPSPVERRQFEESIHKISGGTLPQVAMVYSALRQMATDSGADLFIQDEGGAFIEDESGSVTIGQAKWSGRLTPADMQVTKQLLLSFLSKAADHPREVETAAAEVTAAYPEQRRKVARVAGIMRRPEVATLSQWTLVLMATLLLLHIFGLLPVESVSTAQDSVDDRLLGVLGIAVALGAYIKSSGD